MPQPTMPRKTLTSDELADRWCVTRSTVSRWRMKGIGPPYLKLGKNAKSRVVYLLRDIEAYETKYRVGQ